MNIVTFIAFVPLSSMVAGVLIGLTLGRFSTPRVGFWVLGLFVVVSIALLVRMAAIVPGDEEQAFAPFVTLTGGVFPGLFGGIVGWILGRTRKKRAT
ncbi:hypothetical protein [uncultured Roseovarius sp.]|uniref:hypothetical protein n=1 Tax=uncultured Roseovarius sp. TaxID=293344 RepID=UPI00260A30EA|nr:hypothetical protein [uncultured Roseovarius sp.]